MLQASEFFLEKVQISYLNAILDKIIKYFKKRLSQLQLIID